MRSVTPLLAVAAVSLALLGCGPENTQVGDVQVLYRVGSGSTTCEDVGIRNVRVYLMTSATEVGVDKTVPCVPDDPSVLFEDVPEGSYFVRVEGLDAGAQPIYTGMTAERLDVVGGQTNGPFTVILDQLRPSIQIWFGFSEVGGCERFGVVDIRVVLYENGASETYDEVFDCVELTTGEGLLIEGLSDSATYDVRVRGTNDNSEYTYDFDVDDVAVEAGAPTELNAELEPCSGLCGEP